VETKWLYAGVPNGVRLTPFWRIDQDRNYGKGWHVHRFTSFENPLQATPDARAALIDEYGSENENEYLNNVLGLWGEERSSAFPSAHVEASQSPDQPFVAIEVSDSQANAARSGPNDPIPWRSFLDPLDNVAQIVGQRARVAVLGMDHGFSPDPTVIYIAYLDSRASEVSAQDTWRVLGRVTLLRIANYEQAACIDTLRTLLGERLGGPLAGICADTAGYGRSVYYDHLFVLADRYDTEWYRSHTQEANFGSTEAMLDEFGEPMKDRNGIVTKRRRKQTSTELIKEAFAENVRDNALVALYVS
jgi:hypothetical protein